jgi:hypothetical protein
MVSLWRFMFQSSHLLTVALEKADELLAVIYKQMVMAREGQQDASQACQDSVNEKSFGSQQQMVSREIPSCTHARCGRCRKLSLIKDV